MLEISELSCRLAVVAQRRSAGLNRPFQHVTHRRRELGRARALDAPRHPPGRDASFVKRFTGVDVTDPGDHGLIEQCRLYRRPAALQACCQSGAVKSRINRFRTQFGQHRMHGQLGVRRQIHEAEAPRVVEPDGEAAGRLEDDMVVRLFRRRLAGKNAKPPRHAEVRDQHGIVLELDQEELGAAADPLHLAPSQPLAKAVRERKPQVRTAQYDTLQAAPLEGRRQTAADGFDFGQFRHGVSRGCGLNPMVMSRPTARVKTWLASAAWAMVRPMPTDMERQQGEIHFGFRTVAEDEKASMVRGVFDSVAPHYDLMNDLMSLGVHRLWKRAMLDWLAPRPGMTLLDVGGGTGDIGFRFLKRGGDSVRVVDVNAEMLAHGWARAIDSGILDGIEWIHGDAEALPIDDASVDAYTTAFAIRNVTHIERALAEARRALKPGGRFLCLEFSRVAVPLLDRVYDAYSFKVLPALGGLVAGDREAYEYLAESIRRFPDQDRFAGMIVDAGLDQVKFRNLSGGIAAMHSAWRV